jgi:hypothetical protein
MYNEMYVLSHDSKTKSLIAHTKWADNASSYMRYMKLRHSSIVDELAEARHGLSSVESTLDKMDKYCGDDYDDDEDTCENLATKLIA